MATIEESNSSQKSGMSIEHKELLATVKQREKDITAAMAYLEMMILNWEMDADETKEVMRTGSDLHAISQEYVKHIKMLESGDKKQILSAVYYFTKGEGRAR